MADTMTTKLMICFIIMFHLLHESMMHAIIMIAAAWTMWMSKQYNPVTATPVAIAQMAEYLALRVFAFMIVTCHTIVA